MQHAKLLRLWSLVRGLQRPHNHRLRLWTVLGRHLLPLHLPHRVGLALQHLVLRHDRDVLALDPLPSHHRLPIVGAVRAIRRNLTRVLREAIEQLLVEKGELEHCRQPQAGSCDWSVALSQ